jgi:hypothetical protein
MHRRPGGPGWTVQHPSTKRSGRLRKHSNAQGCNVLHLKFGRKSAACKGSSDGHARPRPRLVWVAGGCSPKAAPICKHERHKVICRGEGARVCQAPGYRRGARHPSRRKAFWPCCLWACGWQAPPNCHTHALFFPPHRRRHRRGAPAPRPAAPIASQCYHSGNGRGQAALPPPWVSGS